MTDFEMFVICVFLILMSYRSGWRDAKRHFEKGPEGAASTDALQT